MWARPLVIIVEPRFGRNGDVCPLKKEFFFTGVLLLFSCGQEEIHQLLLNFAEAGANVVRLKGGDPLVSTVIGPNFSFFIYFYYCLANMGTHWNLDQKLKI